MIRPALACLAALFMGMQARAETVYVKAGKLVDVEAGRVLSKSCITIVDSRITAIGRCARPPEGARVVDWQRYTVLPGLIDLHTHFGRCRPRRGYCRADQT